MAGQGSRSAMMVLLGTVAVVLLSCRGAAATAYQVGDTNWKVPSDANFYDDWSAKQLFVIGDTIEFKYDQNSHNVASLTSASDFSLCNVSQAKLSNTTGDTKIELKTAGTKYYVCQVAGHCGAGMKVQIVVLPAGAATPAGAPTAGGTTGTPGEAPAPANAAVPRFGTAIGYGTVAAMVISAASVFL